MLLIVVIAKLLKKLRIAITLIIQELGGAAGWVDVSVLELSLV
jgi:hypothetical protein